MKILYEKIPSLSVPRMRMLNRTLRVYEALRPLVRGVRLHSYSPAVRTDCKCQQCPSCFTRDGMSGKSCLTELFLHLDDLRTLTLEYDHVNDVPGWTWDEIEKGCRSLDALRLSREGRTHEDNLFLEDKFLVFVMKSPQLSQLQLSHIETVPGFPLEPLWTPLTRLLVDTSDLSSEDLAVRVAYVLAYPGLTLDFLFYTRPS
jgi:hypothetical protein